MFFAPTFLVLAAVTLIALFLILRSQKAHKEQEMELSAEELKVFNERFRFNGNRAEMPTRFQAISVTSDNLRRTSLVGTLAVLACIVFVIFKGPNL